MRRSVPKKKAYLAGPMTGLPEFNFPAFHAAAADLRKRGWEIFSPAERDESDGFDPKNDAAKSFDYYMAFDLPAVCNADAVIVLPGWEKSKGANLEVHVARQCDKPVLAYPDLAPVSVKESVAQEAHRIVNGVRQADYGHPADDFARTAALWRARFGWDVKTEDIPAAMRLVKESRLANSPRHRDSLTDIAGYAATQELVWERLDRA